MSDEFLLQLREEPSPQFSHALRCRLEAEARQATDRGAKRRRMALGLAAVALVGLLVAAPGVRATARSLLDLFRVQRFAALPFDTARWQRLAQGLDLRALFGELAEVLEHEGMRPVGSVAEGARLAGIEARVPALVPRGFEPNDVRVQGQMRVRFTVDKAKLDALLGAFEIEDLEIPAGADGAAVTILTPAQLLSRYVRGAGPQLRTLTLAQARSPEVTLPPGLELARIGEVALRVAGMSAAEAHAFAQTIDWSGTLMVPVPVEHATYRQVEVQGHAALLVTSRPPPGRPGEAPWGPGPFSGLLWSDGEYVYGLSGSVSEPELLEMASSLR